MSLPDALLGWYRTSGLARSPLHTTLRRGSLGALRWVGRARGLALPEEPFVHETLQMLSGAYEAEFCALIRSALRPGATALDVGANIGFITRVMAEAVGASGRVLAFEPNPRLFPLTVANNAHFPQVLAFPLGLSASPGVAEFHVAHDSMATGSLYASYVLDGAPPWDRQVDTLRVQLASGSAILAAAGIEHFDLLKVDVEGHEIAVLDGLGAAIEQNRRLVALVEAWLPAQRAAGHTDVALFECLTRLGFAVSGHEAGALHALTSGAAYVAYCERLRDRTMLYCTKG